MLCTSPVSYQCCMPPPAIMFPYQLSLCLYGHYQWILWWHVDVKFTDEHVHWFVYRCVWAERCECCASGRKLTMWKLCLFSGVPALSVSPSCRAATTSCPSKIQHLRVSPGTHPLNYPCVVSPRVRVLLAVHVSPGVWCPLYCAQWNRTRTSLARAWQLDTVIQYCIGAQWSKAPQLSSKETSGPTISIIGGFIARNRT